MKLRLIDVIGLLEGPPRLRRVEILTNEDGSLVITGALKPRDLTAKQRLDLGVATKAQVAAARRKDQA